MNYTQCLIDDFSDESVYWNMVDFNYVSTDGKKIIDVMYINCDSVTFYVSLLNHYNNNVDLIKEFCRLSLQHKTLYPENRITLFYLIQELNIDVDVLNQEDKMHYLRNLEIINLMTTRENIIEYINLGTIQKNYFYIYHYYSIISEDDPELTQILIDNNLNPYYELYNVKTFYDIIIQKDYLQSFIIMLKLGYKKMYDCFLLSKEKIFNYILHDENMDIDILKGFSRCNINFYNYEYFTLERIEIIIDTIITRVDFTIISPKLLFENSLIYKVNLDLIKKAFYVIKNITDGFNSKNLKNMMKIADEEINKFIFHELGYDRFIDILGPKIDFVTQFYLENDDFCEYYKHDIVEYLMSYSDLDKLKDFINRTNYELKSDQIVNTTSIEIIKYLVNYGVVINVHQIIYDARDNDVNQIINFISYMINEHDYDINKIVVGNNCLHEAAYVRNFSLIKYLIEDCGMDMMTKNNMGSTVFHLYRYYDLTIIKYIVEKYDVDLNIINKQGVSILTNILNRWFYLDINIEILIYLRKLNYDVRNYCEENSHLLRMLNYE